MRTQPNGSSISPYCMPVMVSYSFCDTGPMRPSLTMTFFPLWWISPTGRIRTQPARFGLGSYCTVGRAYGQGVTEDLPGERPWAFTGTISWVAIDLSGRQYVDLEKEARAVLAQL